MKRSYWQFYKNMNMSTADVVPYYVAHSKKEPPEMFFMLSREQAERLRNLLNELSDKEGKK